MEAALRLDLPIIGVNLNGSRQRDSRCPSTIRDELVVYMPFAHDIIEYAMDHWPASHKSHKSQGHTGPYYYKDEVYNKL